MITFAELKKGLIAAIRVAIPNAKVFADKIPQGGTAEPFFHLAFEQGGEASGKFHEKRYITVTIRFFPLHSDEVASADLAWAAFHTLNKRIFGSTITFSTGEYRRALNLFRRRGEVVDDVLVFRFDLEFEELLDTDEMRETFDFMEWYKIEATDPNAGDFTGASGEEPKDGD